MDLDDGFGMRQAPRETCILPLETDNFGGKWVGITGLRTAFAGLQCAQRSHIALPAPVSKGRRIKPLATQDGANPAGLTSAISLGKDA